jgi:hypothetical protein
VSQERRKPIRATREWEYNADADEMMEAQRLARKIISDAPDESGEVVIHHNRGRVLKITLREVSKTVE